MDGLDCKLSLVLRNPDDKKKAVTELDKWGCCPRCILRFLGEKEQHIYRNSAGTLAAWVEYVVNRGPIKNGNHEKSEEIDKVKGDSAKEKDISHESTSMDTTQAKSDGDNKPNIKTKDSTDVTAEKMDDETKTGDEKSEINQSNSKDIGFVCVACLGMLQDRLCSDEFLQEIKAVVDKGGHEFHNYFCSVSTPVNVCLREHAIWLSLKRLFPKDFIGEITEDDVASIKEVWKWINGRPLANLLGTYFSVKSDFTVSLNFTHEASDKECAFLYDLYPNIFKQRKNNKKWEVFTRVSVLKAISDTKDAKFEKNYCCPPRRLTKPLVCDPMNSFHEPVFLAGRYNKYSRAMSQTPWLLDSGRKTNNSVEEVLCLNANQHIKAKEYRFASSGREDVDVRMLGRGRPFVVEFIDPKKEKFTTEEMGALQKQINATTPDVQVRDLQLVSREDTQVLKTGEIEKTKNYSALCYASRELTAEDLEKMNSINELVLNQKTPIRVLHRRPLATRERTVHSAKAELIEGSTNHFKLTLSTQAGTYIKEFVHGDFGRTSPNLGELLDTECDILELDVEDVMLDWPPPIEYSS